MKILLVNDNLGNYGGAEISLRLTEKLLIENGHEVRVFGSTKGETPLSYFSRFYSTAYYVKIRSLIREFKPHLIHFNSVSRILSPSVIVAAVRQGIPCIMTVRDPHLCCARSWAITKNGKDCPGFALKCLWRCKGDQNIVSSLPLYLLKYLKVKLHRKIISSQVKYFISPSKKLKELIEREFSLAGDAVFWIPNFIELGKDEKPDYSSINPKKFLYVGRVSNEKGIDTAILAFNKLVHKAGLSDISLDIVGSGPALKRLQWLVKRKSLQDNITFKGKIENTDLDSYYQEACAVVMPSIWMENNPRTALEAMKHGKPIIASNLGGYPDLIDLEETGYLFEAGNPTQLAKHIKTLYDNQELSTRLGGKAFKKLCSEFSKESHYQKLMKAYLRLTGVSAIYRKANPHYLTK